MPDGEVFHKGSQQGQEMIIGFTGTRKGMTSHQMIVLSGILQTGDEFHHGDCVGADAEAHDIARCEGCRIVIHPPDNDKYRAFCIGTREELEKPYLERNHDIVDACDLLVATPDGPEAQRSGTWATIRYAREVGKEVKILERSAI